MDNSSVINFLIAAISGGAACWSAYSAYRARSIQISLTANKNDIYRICKLIDHFRLTLALQKHPNNFSDDEFIAGFDQSEAKKNISILKQNAKLLKILSAFDWENHTNIEQKIEGLEQCRSQLF